MATITFDTLKFVEKLKAAGIPESHAKAEVEALTSAFSEILDSSLATKVDLKDTEKHLIERIAVVEGEIKLLKWMNALVIGGILTLILKAFFQ